MIVTAGIACTGFVDLDTRGKLGTVSLGISCTARDIGPLYRRGFSFVKVELVVQTKGGQSAALGPPPVQAARESNKQLFLCGLEMRAIHCNWLCNR